MPDTVRDPLVEERASNARPTVHLVVKTLPSLLDQIDFTLDPGESRSSFVRKAVVSEVKRRARSRLRETA